MLQRQLGLIYLLKEKMTNLSPTNLTPGGFVQLNVPVGPGAALNGPTKVLVIANGLASAPYVPNTVYGPDVVGFVVGNHNDVVAVFGAGSEAQVGYDAFVLANPNLPVYLIAPNESTGSAATLTVTFTNAATSFGTVTSYCNGTFASTNVSSGDSTTTIATNVAATINQQVNWQVSASPSVGTVVVTAKNKGPRGNHIYFASQVGNGLTGTTSSAQSFAYLSSGSVEDVWTSTLAAISTTQFDYIFTAAEDGNVSGNLGLLNAQVVSMALAVPGLPQRVVDGYVGTEAQAAVTANLVNGVNTDLAWEKNSNYTPIQLAGHLCGCLTNGEGQSTVMLNFDGAGVRSGTESMWQFGVPFDGTKTSPTDVTAALISGLTPIATSSVGKTYVVKACTTYHVNPLSSTLDLRVTDHCIVTIGNIVRAALIQNWSDNFEGKTAAQNPQPGDKAPNELVVTPDILTASIGKVLARQVSNGFLQDYNVVSVALNSVGTFNCVVEILPVTLAHQMNVDLNSVSAIL
jgi:phage tail sheath gpL-like